MAVTLSETARNGIADYVCGRINDGGTGSVRFFTSGNSLVAKLNFSDIAFQPAVGGTAVNNPISPDAFTLGGVIDTFKVFSGGGIEIFGGTCSAISGGGDIELFTLTITPNDVVDLSRLTFSAPS
jgi:hypothetical protein